MKPPGGAVCRRQTAVTVDLTILFVSLINLLLHFLPLSFFIDALPPIPVPLKAPNNYTEAIFSDSKNLSVVEKYTAKELESAIRDLNLPTWSRGFVPCDSPRSEVTCAQVFRAWRVLNGWSESQKQNFSHLRHFLMQHLYDGVGNRFSTDTATIVIALMDNRTYTVQSTFPSGSGGAKVGQAFDFHPAVTIVRSGQTPEVDRYFATHGLSSYHVYTFDSWFTYDYASIFPLQESIKVDLLLYATMPYTNPQMADFCYNSFGRHMVYFVCNYFMRIPEIAWEQARRAIDPVTPDIRTFGVHLRFHIAGEYFSYSVERTFESIYPFLTFLVGQKPTVFAFASDSAALEKRFAQAFGKQMVRTPALRQSDGDHLSALYDLAMLEMSKDLLLTYRSTFSYMAMARTARRAWFIDKETPDVFQITNSQASIISMLYHQFDFNDWQPSRRFHISDGVEASWRKYYKYFML
jgi:hypothetical protein